MHNVHCSHFLPLHLVALLDAGVDLDQVPHHVPPQHRLGSDGSGEQAAREAAGENIL